VKVERTNSAFFQVTISSERHAATEKNKEVANSNDV
jgi:hypothetical protein